MVEQSCGKQLKFGLESMAAALLRESLEGHCEGFEVPVFRAAALGLAVVHTLYSMAYFWIFQISCQMEFLKIQLRFSQDKLRRGARLYII